MSVGYVPVQWNRQKRIYDAIVVGSVLGYLCLWVLCGKLIWRGAESISDEILILRGLGSCAFLLLTVILLIGPVARLDRRFLPLLYNRRHLGVLTCLIACAHGILAIGYYHGFGVDNPLFSLFVNSAGYRSFAGINFELFGAGALVILITLASTSHDFWLRNLSPRIWKRLHMLVYVAYGLLIAHVGLGALQTDRNWAFVFTVLVSVLSVSAAHVAAAMKEASVDQGTHAHDGWIDAGLEKDIPMNRARTVCASGGERIAIFRHADGLAAVTNVCAHQGGPLSEGRIIDGCITCPWHGWQYKTDGCSPPPFQERVATYQVRVVAGRVQVSSQPSRPQTAQSRSATHG
ncbi:MAG: ferric reductase-like transmembrane domain-containing protein [Phycisphaerales bacterium]|nr:ferric reductase-like transmembrane domain-containing protein [Planctomycetota bacterium]